ncbi:MAG TPA: hypothetical protein VF511_05235, partial [Chthoniobacterales bacterium]
MVERATWAQERVVTATLADIVERVGADGSVGPSLFLIGAALERVLHRMREEQSAEISPALPHG